MGGSSKSSKDTQQTTTNTTTTNTKIGDIGLTGDAAVKLVGVLGNVSVRNNRLALEAHRINANTLQQVGNIGLQQTRMAYRSINELSSTLQQTNAQNATTVQALAARAVGDTPREDKDASFNKLITIAGGAAALITILTLYR